MSEKGFCLRCKDELNPGIRNNEGFDSNLVACEPQGTLAPVQIGEGKHSIQAIETVFRSPMVQGAEKDLGVARAPKGDALTLEVAAQLAIVVDFSIVNDGSPSDPR